MVLRRNQLRHEPDFLEKSFHSFDIFVVVGPCGYWLQRSSSVPPCYSSRKTKNTEFISKYVKQCEQPWELCKYIKIRDRKMLIMLLENNIPNVLKYFDKEFYNDRDIVLLAAQKGYNILAYTTLRNDREIIIEQIKNSRFY
jgi:hypothetical protein